MSGDYGAAASRSGPGHPEGVEARNTASTRLMKILDSGSVLKAFGWALVAGMVALAIVRPIIGYDAWWYHLPYSSFIWHIGGGAEAFHLDPISSHRWLGFPVLWEAIQGLFWRVTGSLNSVILPQLLLCLLYFVYVRRVLAVPVAWLGVGFFSCPMLLIHFESTYVDLPSGISLAILFFTLALMVSDAAEGDGQWWSWPRVMTAILMATIAGNTKFQGLLACIGLAAVVLLVTVALPQIRARRKCGLVAIVAAASIAASGSALSNLVHYENPFYPIRVEVLGHVVFDGPESSNMSAEYPVYLLTESRQVSLPEAVNFLLSASELDWTMRGVAPWYNVDSVSGRTPKRGPPSRTGGWGSVFVLFNGGVLLLQLVTLGRLADRRQKLLIILAALLTLVTAFMPRAHELRYWLYLPLVVLPTNLRFLKLRWGENSIPTNAILLGIGLYGVALPFLSPKSGLLEMMARTEAARRGEVPGEVAEALARTGRYCGPLDDRLFRYSTAVTGLPGLVSRNAEDCR